MGIYQVIIHAQGGDVVCSRDKGDGDIVIGCEYRGCPDCMVRELVRRMKRNNERLEKAEIIHWPGTGSEVRDDLLTGKRSGGAPK